jgi:asparagine synthase (glutamine-hydrolysing)
VLQRSLRGVSPEKTVMQKLIQGKHIVRQALLNDIQFTDVTHPWISASRELPPGKLFQVLSIAGVPPHNPFLKYGKLENVSPILSKPLVETLLRIPTYLLCLGGITRGLARSTFKDVLPAPIQSRFAKGTNAPQWLRLLEDEDNRAFTRDLLLDGNLSSQGILDRQRIEKYLQPGAPVPHECFREMMVAIATESWTQRWAH